MRTQTELRLLDAGHREAPLQAVQHHADRRRSRSIQHPQQVHEGGVLPKLPAEGETPVRRFEPPVRSFSKEHLVLCPDVVLGGPVAGRVHPLGEPGLRHEVRADDRVPEKFVDPLAHLPDDGIRREPLVEDGRNVVEDGGPGPGAADGRGRAGADQLLVCL